MSIISNDEMVLTLRRILLRIIQAEMVRDPKKSAGLTLPAIIQLFESSDASIKDVPEVLIQTALKELTWNAGDLVFLTLRNKKYKPTPSAPPLSSRTPPPGTISTDAPLGGSAGTMIVFKGSPHTERTPTAAQRRVTLRQHNLAVTTLGAFSSALAMSQDHDGPFLQRESTREASQIITIFMPDVVTMEATATLTLDQDATLAEANAAVNTALRKILLSGRHPDLLKNCPFCHASRLSMAQCMVEDLAPNTMDTVWNRHFPSCAEFIPMASSLQLEVKRVGTHDSNHGRDFKTQLLQRTHFAHRLTKASSGSDTTHWPQVLEGLGASITAAIEKLTETQRLYVRLHHHHWVKDPVQEGADALLAQIAAEICAPLDTALMVTGSQRLYVHNHYLHWSANASSGASEVRPTLASAGTSAPLADEPAVPSSTQAQPAEPTAPDSSTLDDPWDAPPSDDPGHDDPPEKDPASDKQQPASENEPAPNGKQPTLDDDSAPASPTHSSSRQPRERSSSSCHSRSRSRQPRGEGSVQWSDRTSPKRLGGVTTWPPLVDESPKSSRRGPTRDSSEQAPLPTGVSSSRGRTATPQQTRDTDSPVGGPALPSPRPAPTPASSARGGILPSVTVDLSSPENPTPNGGFPAPPSTINPSSFERDMNLLATHAILHVLNTQDNGRVPSAEDFLFREVTRKHPKISPRRVERVLNKLTTSDVLEAQLVKDGSGQRYFNIRPETPLAESGTASTPPATGTPTCRATILAAIGDTATLTPPGITAKALWPSIHAADPTPKSFTQMGLVQLLEHLFQQGVLVSLEGATKIGRKTRLTIKPGYDHLADVIAQFSSSDDEDGGSPAADLRDSLSGASKGPSSKAPPDAPPLNAHEPTLSRYHVTPSAEQLIAMSAAILHELRDATATNMYGTTLSQVTAMLAHHFGDRTSPTDVAALIEDMRLRYRVTVWTTRSGTTMVGPSHQGVDRAWLSLASKLPPPTWFPPTSSA